MNKLYLYILLFILFGSIHDNASPENERSSTIEEVPTKTAADVDTIVFSFKKEIADIIEDTIDYNYADFYIVIADTGQNYYELEKKMISLSSDLNLKTDSSALYYDEEKKRIVLPEDHPDEIYAGDYYPRRFPSEHLSLEYLNLYIRSSGENTIALVSGIYDKKEGADSLLQEIQKIEPDAFKVKTNMYVGCMH